MADLSRKHLQESIILGSENIMFHPMIACHRGLQNPVILQNTEFVSYIKALVPKFVACRHCHLLFDYASWCRGKFLIHLERVHQISTGENVNFIFPIVPRNKKQLPVTEPIPIPEAILILEPNSLNSEEIPHPPPEAIQVVATPLQSDVPLVISEAHPLKKKRGRKPKKAESEKEEKKPKLVKAKNSKKDLTSSNL